jgi:hypothetical protein
MPVDAGQPSHSALSINIAAGGLTIILSGLYVLLGGVWSSVDVWSAITAGAFVWLPVGVCLFLILRSECSDALEALVLASAGAIAFSTAISFACDTLAIAWPWAKHLPGVIRGVVLAGACGLLFQRRREAAAALFGVRPDWTLLALIVASLCATARFQRPFEIDQGGRGVRYILDGDQTYFAALAQELQRSNPAGTCAVRAGVSERPYHHLPHLTVALLASACDAPDVIRLHLVTGYTALVSLSCCLMFVLTRELSGSRAAGLFGAFLLFIAAFPMPPFLQSPFKFYYFTLWPQASSTVEPVLLTSPQMFWGVTLALAVLLGLLKVLRSMESGRRCAGLALSTAVMAALLLRFRIHCFIVLAPIVGSFLTWLTVKYRRWALLPAVGALAAISIAEVLEMRLPVYLHGGESLRIGNNAVALRVPFMNGWPGAELAVKGVFASLPAETAAWVWQFLSLSAFSGLNLVGIPLAWGVCRYCRSAWRHPHDRPIVWMLLGIVGITVIAAASVASGYDAISLGMQLPFALSWYLLPCGAAGLWDFVSRCVARVRFVSSHRDALGLVAVGLAALVQLNRGPGFSQSAVQEASFRISADEMAAFQFIHQELPVEAVLVPTYLHPNVALWSGFGGRRSYLDYLPASGILDPLIPPSESADARLTTLEKIVMTSDETELAETLRRVPGSHLVEHARRPLSVHPAEALRLIWKSRNSQVAIWEITR